MNCLCTGVFIACLNDHCNLTSAATELTVEESCKVKTHIQFYLYLFSLKQQAVELPNASELQRGNLAKVGDFVVVCPVAIRHLV